MIKQDLRTQENETKYATSSYSVNQAIKFAELMKSNSKQTSSNSLINKLASTSK